MLNEFHRGGNSTTAAGLYRVPKTAVIILIEYIFCLRNSRQL